MWTLLKYININYSVMNNCTIWSIAGGSLGFVAWLFMLESEKMTGVIFRKDEHGEEVFTPSNIVLYAKAPFNTNHKYFWTPEFFTHNWVHRVVVLLY